MSCPWSDLEESVEQLPVRPRMLVVEDDLDLQPVVWRAAYSIDPLLIVDWATSAGSARRRLESRRYVLVLADYLLAEGSSGLRVARWARPASGRFAMMSAFPVRDEMVGCGLAGCPFLPKPFSLRQLRGFLLGLLPASRSPSLPSAGSTRAVRSGDPDRRAS